MLTNLSKQYHKVELLQLVKIAFPRYRIGRAELFFNLLNPIYLDLSFSQNLHNLFIITFLQIQILQ